MIHSSDKVCPLSPSRLNLQLLRFTNIVEVEMSKQLVNNSDIAEGVTVFTMVAKSVNKPASLS